MKTRSTRSRCGRLRMRSQSRHSARAVRTKRSAIAFAFGARTGVLTIRMPSLRKTSSKGPLYLLSRSRIRKRAPCSEKSRPRLRACWVIQAPLGFFVQPASQTRRLEPRPCENTADARRRHAEAELGQLAVDPPMAPARILTREPQHQLPDLSRERWPSARSGRLTPLPAHERPMPAKQRPRRHHKHPERRSRQVTGDGRQQGSISCAKLRPRPLASEDVELVAQHQQLDVFYVQAAAATNQRTEHGPKSEVEEGEDHVA